MVNVLCVVAFASIGVITATDAFETQTHGRILQVVDFRDEVLDEVNKARQERKLEELCINNKLMDAAQIHANDMTENNFIRSKGSDGSLPKDRAKAQGFTAETVTEIVGAGYRTAKSVVAAWTKSATADSTLLSGEVNVLGAGYSYDRTKKLVHFWVVDFSTGECGDGDATTGAPGNPPNGTGNSTTPTPKNAGSGSGDDSNSGGDGPLENAGPTGGGEVTPAPASGDPGPPPSGNTPVTPGTTPAPPSGDSGAVPPTPASEARDAFAGEGEFNPTDSDGNAPSLAPLSFGSGEGE